MSNEATAASVGGLKALVETWEGDVDELRPFVEELAHSPDFCGEIFCDEHEAFLAGLALADGATSGAGCDADSALP